jgi:hypothetical protein
MIPEAEHPKKIDPFEIGIYAIEVVIIGAIVYANDCISSMVAGSVTNFL